MLEMINALPEIDRQGRPYNSESEIDYVDIRRELAIMRYEMFYDYDEIWNSDIIDEIEEENNVD